MSPSPMPKKIIPKLLASPTSEKGKNMFAINIKKCEIRNFKTERDAHNAGNGFILFNNAEELLENRNINAAGFGNILVDVYNNYAERQISRFADRKTGAMRVTKLAASMPAEGSTTEGEVSVAKEKSPNGSSNGKDENPSAKKRKASRQFKGKMVNACCEENPRREGTHAHVSMELLMKKGPMLYDEFIKAGGRRPDFAYDVNHGWAEVQE